MEFNAKCLLLEREENNNNWTEEELVIHNVDELRSIFDDKNSVVQVDFSLTEKLYYSTSDIEKFGGVYSKAITDEEIFFMASPLLIVECNETNPIDLSEKVKNKIKDSLQLF